METMDKVDRRSGGHVDPDVAAFDLDGISRQPGLFVEVMNSRAAVVSAPVPRTHQKSPLQRTLPQRPSGARATPLERVNLALQIAESVIIITHGYFSCGARGQTGHRQHLDERHTCLFFNLITGSLPRPPETAAQCPPSELQYRRLLSPEDAKTYDC
jgi:hypothetical protein